MSFSPEGRQIPWRRLASILRWGESSKSATPMFHAASTKPTSNDAPNPLYHLAVLEAYKQSLGTFDESFAVTEQLLTEQAARRR